MSAIEWPEDNKPESALDRIRACMRAVPCT
jgi:hypothetical protein